MSSNDKLKFLKTIFTFFTIFIAIGVVAIGIGRCEGCVRHPDGTIEFRMSDEER